MILFKHQRIKDSMFRAVARLTPWRIARRLFWRTSTQRQQEEEVLRSRRNSRVRQSRRQEQRREEEPEKDLTVDDQ